jgi:quinol monooxygenase YgiN
MYLVMWTHVRDYDDWKAVFDTGEPIRKEYLCTGHEIYRDVDDPNQLTVFLEFPSKARAKAFFDDPRLKEKMREAGVESEPRTMFVSQTQQTDYRRRRAA